MELEDYYFSDPRVVLAPVEGLRPEGLSPAFRRVALARRALPEGSLDLLGRGFALYWRRSADLARRAPPWPAPRRRHVAILREPLSVHPLAQLLNESAWTLYACDLEVATSHEEMVAALLAVGDWMTATGEVTRAALRGAAWWLERTAAECEAFVRAAHASARPDAGAWRALADALPWLRRLGHDALRPLAAPESGRVIPGTGLRVPLEDEARPPLFVATWRHAAREAVEAYGMRWRASGARESERLVTWLFDHRPSVRVELCSGELLYDPELCRSPEPLRSALAASDGVAIRALHDDLELLAEHSARFLAACADPAPLETVPLELHPGGYAYLHPEARRIALRLDEPGIERLHGPPLPWARAMLGARCLHEWAHLADAAGWVPVVVSQGELEQRRLAVVEGLDALLARAPASLRPELDAELDAMCAAARAGPQVVGGPDAPSLLPSAERPGTGAMLLDWLATRLPDYRANLVLARFASLEEAETYVRHNVRSHGRHYRPGMRLRLLLRYLYELQMLRPQIGLSRVSDPLDTFLACTGVERELFAPGLLDETAFGELGDRVGALCEGFGVAPGRFLEPQRHFA